MFGTLADHVVAHHIIENLIQTADNAGCGPILYSESEQARPRVVVVLSKSEPIDLLVDAATNRESFLAQVVQPLDSVVYQMPESCPIRRGAKVHINLGMIADVNIWANAVYQKIITRMSSALQDHHYRIHFDPRDANEHPNKIKQLCHKVAAYLNQGPPYEDDHYLAQLAAIKRAKASFGTFVVARHEVGLGKKFAAYLSSKGYSYFIAADMRPIKAGDRPLGLPHQVLAAAD